MLRLSKKGKAEAVAVPLGGGAIAMVRPASTFETDRAIARATNIVSGLALSQDSAALAADLLGEDFTEADFTTREWLESAAQRISLLELAVLCVESWEGVVDNDETPIEHPSRETLALLLRDVKTARAVNEAIGARVNQEISEKNVSGSLPTGAAATAAASVQAAAN